MNTFSKSRNSTFYFLFSTFWLFLLLSTFYFLFSFALSAEAAILYIEPAGGEYHQGDTFIIEVRIDAQGECVNAVKADLKFPQDVLEAIDFSQGDSILTIWLEKAEIVQSAGLVSFTGGIPGGYCGILPGDPGKSNLLGKIIFRAKHETDTKLIREIEAKVEFLESSKVLLNDGFGTPAKSTLKGVVLSVLPGKKEKPENPWKKELEKDDTPPESFKIEIQKDPSVFEGKYFIVFSSSDKQTGIDYYEITETSPWWKLRKTNKEKGDSPYLLKDQSLNSIIKVKALDKAGNERIAEYIPAKKPFPLWIIILVLTGGIIWWTIRKQKIESRK